MKSFDSGEEGDLDLSDVAQGILHVALDSGDERLLVETDRLPGHSELIGDLL